MKSPSLPAFPNYLQLRERSRIPLWLWHAGRVVSVAAAIACIAALFVVPQYGLDAFWKLAVPLLPLVFFAAPGLWRNLCPLAAVNQLPRALSLSRGLAPPRWLAQYAYVIAVVALFALVSARKWLFEADGTATAALLIAALAAALAGGLLFKGKSGWCSSICPLFPVQRLYNQTPFVTIANSHCRDCVGCSKNCYDFNPGVAYLADLNDDDRHYRNHRKFFAAAFPGFILAFFTVPAPDTISLPDMYARFLFCMLLSAGCFFALYAFVRTSVHTLTAVFAMTALNVFYWFSAPAWVQAAGSVVDVSPPSYVAWTAQAAILGLSLAWLRRTRAKEPLFLQHIAQGARTHLAAGAVGALRHATERDNVEVTFMPGEVRVLAQAGRTLLEIAEGNNQPIEAGCRMGMCGADPVLILNGAEHLQPAGEEERGTLDRLGLGGNARLACMCRPSGPVSLALDAKSAAVAGPPARASSVLADPSIRRIAVIGNGIAGVTACDHIRRHHPECEIALVGRERHHLYNRMAITRLIYGRSAMSGLYLQNDGWYDERRLGVWLNTHVARIDRENARIVLGTGDVFDYDRLVLASGSSGVVPAIEGFGMAGTFVLRDADDAMHMRAYVQAHRCRRAAVAGGGLLGLEAAYALHKLGLEVTVIERGPWLLRRQLDHRAGELLSEYLEGLGMRIMLNAETAGVTGSAGLTGLELKDGRALPADLLLAAAGVSPNTALALEAGLRVNRGVLVDECMRTSDPAIYAAGDVCEFEGNVPGLWPAAVEQARVAAINAIGGNATYAGIPSACTLKVAGVDLTSIGVTEARGPDDIEIVPEETGKGTYRKLVVSEGRLAGAILLGYPRDAPAVTAAVRTGRDAGAVMAELRAGSWDVLGEAPRQQAVELAS